MRVIMWVCCFVVGLLAGCTTIGMEPYLEKNPVALANAKQVAGHPERSTIFFYRRYPLGTPNPGVLPPYQFAVDGQIISAMPVGSYVVLSLPPGRHTLTRLSENRWKDTGYDRHDLEINTAAGKSYYVGASNGLSLFSALQEDGVEAGEKFLQHAQLAKFYFVPVSLDGFLAQSAARKAQRTEAGSQPRAAPLGALAPVRPPQSTSAPALPAGHARGLRDFLPSEEQVSKTLEVVAVVAFFALLIFAGAAAASAGGSLVIPPSGPPPASVSTPVEVVRGRPVEVVGSTGNRARTMVGNGSPYAVQTSSGVTEGIFSGKGQGRISLPDGGFVTVDGTRLSGSNGLSGTIVGRQIFMSGGQPVRILNDDTIETADGRRCRVPTSGGIVRCY